MRIRCGTILEPGPKYSDLPAGHDAFWQRASTQPLSVECLRTKFCKFRLEILPEKNEQFAKLHVWIGWGVYCNAKAGIWALSTSIVLRYMWNTIELNIIFETKLTINLVRPNAISDYPKYAQSLAAGFQIFGNFWKFGTLIGSIESWRRWSFRRWTWTQVLLGQTYLPTFSNPWKDRALRQCHRRQPTHWYYQLFSKCDCLR